VPWNDPSFFPIGVWFESVTQASDCATDKDCGLNTYVVLTSNSDGSIIRAAGGLYTLAGGYVNVGSEHAGNSIGDEADMYFGPGWGADRTSGGGYTTMQNAANASAGFMRHANYGKGVAWPAWENDTQAAVFVNTFQEIVSDDIYWYTDTNCQGQWEGASLLPYALDPTTHQPTRPLTPDEAHRASNYGAVVARVRKLANPKKPIWGFVEVGHPSSLDSEPTNTGPQIAAAVWHMIIQGARGIIYFNHSFGGPNQSQHCLRETAYASQRASVKATNATIKQLAPVLNAPFADGLVSATPGVAVMAKSLNGKYTVFSGNGDNQARSATFTIAGITTGTAVVVGENRSIAISGGTFTDSFTSGTATHIYQIA
jgi:hypothetical protein